MSFCGSNLVGKDCIVKDGSAVGFFFSSTFDESNVFTLIVQGKSCSLNSSICCLVC